MIHLFTIFKSVYMCVCVCWLFLVVFDVICFLSLLMMMMMFHSYHTHIPPSYRTRSIKNLFSSLIVVVVVKNRIFQPSHTSVPFASFISLIEIIMIQWFICNDDSFFFDLLFFINYHFFLCENCSFIRIQDIHNIQCVFVCVYNPYLYHIFWWWLWLW